MPVTIVPKGTTVTGVTLIAGDQQFVFGTAIDTTIAGGEQLLFSGGVAKHTTINNGGTQLLDGFADFTTINVGGLQSDAGSVDHTTINGGTQVVISGAKATTTTINSGIETVRGSAIDTIIEGGEQDITTGTANHTTIEGGKQVVFQSGTALDTTILPQGGIEDVFGTANNTTLRGGSEIVESGGTAGNTTIRGGLLDLKDGALTSASITFGPGKEGTLQIDQPVTSNLTFKAPLIDISKGDKIDLTGLTFTKATTATVTGSTLLVDDHAGHTESFNLITPKTTNFEVSMDNGTGTMLIGIQTHEGHSHV